ncbi:MAG TPA: hypothetical protein VFK61_06130 [Candidatus Limnocylindria bacterium]|jgi:hypothetical protein|nr:hypothetical protein [Candidatus Limnocylindria bacterium]
MSGFDPFAPSPVAVDVYTDAYRISGKTPSRFSRVADIVNQASSTHLVIEEATISEYADPTATISAMQALVDLSQALLVIAAESGEPATRPEMRIPKRAVRAQIGLPPFRVTGSIHVPQGSRPADGVLNASDRFLAMTEVTIACGPHPELARTAAAVAFQRSRAQLILVTDDEHPDQLLADVLDAATAERWLQQAREGEGS